MDDDNDISIELSFLSSTIMSITCAQSHHLSTFILLMSNINTLPLLINRQQEKEIYLTDERNSLLTLIEKLLKENHSNQDLFKSNIDLKQTINQEQEQIIKSTNILKLNRRLSCGLPAKPTWRTATTLRRTQPTCLPNGKKNISIRIICSTRIRC